MRWIASLIVVVLMPPLFAAAEDQVWYVKCRIWNSIPRVGPLHHACVVICDSSEKPYCIDSRGCKVGNPNLTYYGNRPHQSGFSPEEPPVVEITVTRIYVPADVVKDRMASYGGRWTLIKNCQTAAKWATQPDSRFLATVMK